MISKIISGGQTGADQGGLGAAVKLGIPTGGVAPKGFRTEKGSAMWLSKLKLTEHSSSNYPPRTLENIANSDGTVIFGNIFSPGSKLTMKYCNDLNKPFFCVEWKSDMPTADTTDFLVWLEKNSISVLNVAGNREGSNKGIFDMTVNFLVKALG